ncbi:TrbG/VirB9 family P-type conjugative transfer protein [Brevundimonas variabilis]|uniref:Type IV secretion system protein VirB9 n=1 Tax=Brevundimonas variabilis TaxID=74312 RepID=A0A7W9CJH1_9CAUL|nr:TrbG/VirB9 family P-type conjugative transfer protein [Brevundimonas variabilis]MBB5746553.1 type IV secretion system protein VirB9 [Brevundimonas variabilis]
MKHPLPLLTIIAGLALAWPVAAQTPLDPRIRELTYDPGAVYRIAGAFRTATQIVFSPDETIRHAAIGDSVAWEVAAEGSVLFLKPRERHQATNLLVVTERGGSVRHYAFELVASDPGDRSAIAYQVRFRYPGDEQVLAAHALAAETQAVEQRLIGLELERGVVEGVRNLAWSAQGDVALQPSEVSDNGRFTVLRFPGVQALPALFEVGDDGTERLVPYDVRGEFVVVHGVVRSLRLRRGGSVLCLFNDAYDARGVGLVTGTASPAVDRTPVGDRS